MSSTLPSAVVPRSAHDHVINGHHEAAVLRAAARGRRRRRPLARLSTDQNAERRAKAFTARATSASSTADGWEPVTRTVISREFAQASKVPATE